MREVLYAVEGTTDVFVAEKLIRYVGHSPRAVSTSGGSGTLDSKCTRWTRSSNQVPMLILRDWDLADQVPCPAELVDRMSAGNSRPHHVAIRILVRAVESWLMADVEALRAFFRLKKSVTTNPESLTHPKLALTDACRHSSLHRIRNGMLPVRGSGSPVGPHYAQLITEFARDHWDPDRASGQAPSLNRTLRRLEQLVADGYW